jgi:hypothetical protein
MRLAPQAVPDVLITGRCLFPPLPLFLRVSKVCCAITRDHQIYSLSDSDFTIVFVVFLDLGATRLLTRKPMQTNDLF